jgi:hypothetical protein
MHTHTHTLAHSAAEYIWNVGWYGLSGSLEEASHSFSLKATTQFVGTLDAQVSALQWPKQTMEPD